MKFVFCTFSSLHTYEDIHLNIVFSHPYILSIQNLAQLKDETPQNMSLNLNQHQQQKQVVTIYSICLLLHN